MQLPVVPTMIPDRMTLGSHSLHELRPPIGMPTEHEEGGFDATRVECIEDARGRLGVRPVIEGQRHALRRRRDVGDGAPEHEAVRVVHAVNDDGGERASGREALDHAGTRMPPSTLWYTSRTCAVTLDHE